jgi:hypothetical protein
MFFDVTQGQHLLKRTNVNEERNIIYEVFDNQTHSDENDDSVGGESDVPQPLIAIFHRDCQPYSIETVKHSPHRDCQT